MARIDVYQKTDVIPVDTSTGMDDLAALFGSMGMKEQAAQINVSSDSEATAVVQQILNAPEDELIAALGGLKLGGRRRKTRKTRKH